MRRPTALSALLSLLCLAWSSSVLAAGDASRELCFSACQMALRAPRFNDTRPDATKLQRSCLSKFGVTSLYLCLQVHCHGDHDTDAFSHLNQTCRDYVKAPLPPFDIIANYTDSDIAGTRQLTREEATYRTLLGEVVIPTKRLFQLSYDTLDAIVYVHKYHYLYGAAMYMYWIGIIVIALSYRFISSIGRVRHGEYRPLSAREQFENDEITACKGTAHASRPSLWLKQYVTVPAAFGYKCAQNVGWCTIPPRVQSLAIFVFVVLNVFFCVHGYHVFPDNMYWEKSSTQAWRYLSDRTGIISFANFPVIWVFGMRNNLLLWLTGWDFGTYNNFHRWVARVATLQAVVHSIGYTVLVFEDGGWPYFVSYWYQLFWWTGEVATILMCLLLALSVFWMRRHVYEAFLILHILLSIVILVAMLGHVSIFKGRYDGFVWISVLVWVSDRILRISRVLSFNPKFWNTRARASYDKDSDIIRLSIPYSTSYYQPLPGTYYYIHVLNGSRFWESHPFTVASITPREPLEKEQQTRRRSAPTDEGAFLLQGDPDAEAPAVAGNHSEKTPSTLTFLIRPYDSFTGRLRDLAASGTSSSPDGASASLRVLVDGPYGHSQRFDRFDHVLFIVGGSGIVVPLSHLAALTRPMTRPNSVRIIWAVREAEFASEVIREDFGDALLDGGKVALDVHVTRREGMAHSDVIGRPRGMRLLAHRPDVRAEIEVAARTTGGGGSLAVVACGPARMADDARRTVVDMLGRSHVNIEYFEESFNW